MPFDWKGYVDLARNLAETAADAADPEAARRSALSRAYFGAYCHARNYAAAYLGFHPQEHQDDHGALRAHLRNRRRRGDGQRLDDLRKWRNAADYLNDISALGELPDLVAEAIGKAEGVFASLKPPPSV